ncbi:hypothetical protein CJ030_MR1G003752 [Morella rubra]|uniref:Protein kinase domain-containing protein n=1 Tax=Morella rubra TaxID=262757 RepID=A0A6A1WM14_9ROSI|nr:hypothetical protein CJ030_MR1G003752 [Morella rubra]
MTARVGDFGLARVRFRKQVSTYGDVYSYGVLLLEMFTGRKPTDNMFKDGFTLHDFAKASLQEQVINIFDPILLSEGENGKQGEIMCPIKVKKKSQNQRMLEFDTGSWSACSVEIPRERMNMGDVVLSCIRFDGNFLEQMQTEKHFLVQVSILCLLEVVAQLILPLASNWIKGRRSLDEPLATKIRCTFMGLW